MPRSSVHSVGVGFRRRLATSLLAAPARVDFVEIVAESCRGREARREAAAIAEVWPVMPHGVKLSLGSVEGIDEDRARMLGSLARELRAPLVSEHVAFVRAGGREIGHLTELPMTRDAVRVVARNVARLRRHLPDVPLLLENPARGYVWHAEAHEMSEGAFYDAIARASGCGLLLDVANLYANARNAGRSPRALLAEFPLEHVGLIHVAGGVLEDGFYFDTHAHPVPEPVFDLVRDVLAARPDARILLERDARLDEQAAIFAEVDRLRALAPSAARASRLVAAAAPSPARETGEAWLGAEQIELARRLTEATMADATPDRALVRARAVLAKKREEARRAHELERRLLEQRARFAEGGEGPVPRALPWIGRAALDDGTSIWALKSFGAGATVRTFAR